MADIRVYISGEDPVTIAVIERLLDYVSAIFSIIMQLPARGGQVKSKIPEFNKLAKSNPVVMLVDVDEGCAPLLKQKLFEGMEQSPQFLFNVSVDEAEAWLMADRQGFASYFGLDVARIPESVLLKQGGRVGRLEMNFSYKSSLYLTHVLAPSSTKKEIREQVAVTDYSGRTKGKEYNNALIPFIKTYWNIDAAKENSDSLQRMIRRLEELVKNISK